MESNYGSVKKPPSRFFRYCLPRYIADLIEQFGLVLLRAGRYDCRHEPEFSSSKSELKPD